MFCEFPEGREKSVALRLCTDCFQVARPPCCVRSLGGTMSGMHAAEPNFPGPEEPVPQPHQPELPPKKPSEPELPSPDPERPPFPGPGPTDPGLPEPVSY